MSKNKGAKKTLAVFMAVLMVMSCWVFTPISFEAEAATTAGTYDVRVTYSCSNSRNDKDDKDYTGPDMELQGEAAGFTIFYKANNGTDTETYSSSSIYSATSDCKSEFTNKTKTFTNIGFPTKLSYHNDATMWGARRLLINKIEVAANGSTDKNKWYTIYEGNFGVTARSTSHKGEMGLTVTGFFSTDDDGTLDGWVKETAETAEGNWVSPKANKITWTSTSNPGDLTIDKDSNDVSRMIYYNVFDQYGVRMSSSALSTLGTSVTATVKATNYKTLNATSTLTTTTTENLYYTLGEASTTSNIKITAKGDLKSTTLGLNERTVTVVLKAGSVSSTTKTFKVLDPKYTITFDKNDDGGGATDMNPKTAQVYYGETLATQSEIDGALAYPTSGKWDGYTWLGMFVTEKDGSDKMNIDEQVTAKKTYYAHWNEDTYTVVFLARNGKFLDAQYASYGEAVSDTDARAQLAEYEKKNSDSHYKLNSKIWDTDFSNVTTNLIVTAVYDVEAHNFGDSQELKANCEHGSGTVRICQDCGYEERTITDETLGGHTPSKDLTVVVEPTCETEGKGTHYCEVCGISTDDVEIPALGHIYTSKVTKEATCTGTGTRVYTCTRDNCTNSYEETIPMLQHVMENIGSANATCTSGAYTIYKCANCNYTYNVYNKDSEPLEHYWGEWTVTKEATNDTDGEMQRVCSRDENHIETVTIPKGGHTFSTTPTTETPATCHSTGTQTFKCIEHDDCGVSITVTTAMTAHSYITTVTDAKCEAAGSVVTKCENCTSEIKTDLLALGHDWGSGTVNAGDEATCTKTGTRTYTCSRCSEIKTEEIPATGHSFVTIDATCTTDGKKVCSKCDYTEAGEKAGHSFGEETELIKATCVNKGLKIQTCSKCLLSKVTEVDKTDHAWAAGYTVDYDSTCSTVGQKSIHCTVCGQIKDESKETIEKKSHTMGEAETVLEATCTGKGITKTVCKNCGYTETAETDALGHAYTTTSTKNATCTADGEKVETCSKCDDVKTTVLPKTGHKYVAGTPVAATCKDAGHVTMTCACGDSYEKYTEAPALNHDWKVTSTTTHDKTVVTSKCSICGAEVTQEIAGSHKFTKGEVTTTPTCTTDGIVTVKCEVEGCDKSYTINIGKGGHTIETQVTEPNCVDAGKAVSYCTTCNTEISSKVIKAKGHSYTAKITKAATCSAKGEITYTCSECNKTYTEEIAIDENAHKYVKGGNHDATCISPAYDVYTCENGCGSSYNKYDGEASGHTYVTTTSQSGTTLTITCTCSKCSDTHTKDVSVAEGHNYSVATVTKQPTCYEKGIVTIACDKVHDGNCTATITAELDINYDAHNFDTTYNYPTCDSEGSVVTTCVNGCGYMSTANLAKLGHVWNEGAVTTDPTCTTNGEKTFTCTRTGCGETRTEVIAKTGHRWNTGTNHAADCTHGAYTTYKCTVCDETYDAVVNGAVANGHSWNDGEVTTAPTCTEDGVNTYTCSVCGGTKTKVIAKTGHTMDSGTPVAATCTSGAYTIYKCQNKDCGYSYNSYDSAQSAIGHDWGEWFEVTPATNDADGEMKRVCKNDETHFETLTIPKGGHTFDMENPTVVKTATCTSEGEETYACTAHKDCGVTLTVKTDKIAHTLKTDVVNANCGTEGSVTVKCEKCDYKVKETIPALGHGYVKGDHVDATCTSSGYDVYTCSRCGDVKNVISEAATGHDFKEVTDSNTATCTKAGMATYKCANCETTLEVATTALGHDYSVEKETVKAKCNSVGYTVYKCSRCDSTHTEYAEKLGDHTFPTDWTVVQTATDVLPGIKVKECSTCHKFEYEYTAPTGAHTYDDGAVIKEATCTEDGTRVYTCNGTDCGCTDGDRASYTVTIPATGHDKYLDFKDATCTDSGYAIVKCHNCDVVFSTETIAAKGHTYGATPTSKVAPTCSNDGKLVYGCENCTHEKTITIDIVPTAHNWVKESEQAADCKHAGYEIYKCENCGDTYRKFISDPTAHAVDESKTQTVAATCNKAGYVKKYCSCGQLMETVITQPDETAHNWETHTKTAEGCLKSGYSYSECSVCGKIKDIVVADPEGHKYEQRVTKEATCTDGGEVEIYCSTCDKVVQTVTTSALGHTYNDGTVTPATCQNEGSVVYTCTVCGDTLTKTLDKIPHEYAFTKSIEATCTSSGYDVYTCKNCDASYNNVTTNATAHSYTKVADKSEDATCTESGHVYMACSCGANYEYDVPATGHTYTSKVTQSVSCTQPEITTYTCACGDSYTEITKVPTEHTWGAWTTTTAPTEDKAGEQERTCKCGAKETAPIPATGAHVMEEDTTQYQAPTCETEGKKVFVCKTHENCTANYEQTIAALGHSASLEYKAAECNKAGYTKLVCTREDCEKEIKNIEIPALNHSYEETSRTYPTCCEDGKIDYRCANCGNTTSTTLDKTGAHKLTLVETVASTCTTQGYDLYECEYDNCTYACKDNIQPLADHTQATTETINATCASIGYKKNLCSCGAIISVETIPVTDTHEYETKNVDGVGCLTSGYSYKECSVCGKIKDITVTDANGHEYEQRVKTAANCTDGGEVEIYCTTCDAVVQTVTTSPLGHDFSGEPTVEKATCEKEGKITYKCQRTGCDGTLEYTLDKTPHNYVSAGTFNATCTNGAYELFKCSDCGALMKNTTSSAIGHSYEADPSNADVEATCCADGHVYRKCANCDAKYDYVVPATGEHTYDNGTVIQEATCLKSEVTEYRCITDGCTASYREVTADAKGHSYTDWTYAHMTATGKCACGDTITVNIPESATHSWVYDKISSPATCKTVGYIQFKCDVDGCTATLYKEYGPIADAHAWNDGEITTEATCTEDGVKTYTCTKCGITKTETIAKLGHEHTSLVEKVDPTCTTNGYVTYKCVRCDDKVTSIIEKNADNHKFVSVTVDPTCLEDGYTVETCEYCGLEGTKTIHENTALGHREVVNETKPDCTTAGSKITYCDRCNTIIKTESSAALGHDENRTNITPATCEDAGKDHVTCSRCDYEADETVDALGHDWNDGEIIVVGNCERQQVTRYTCKRCGDTKDVLTGEIAKHNYEYKGTVAPTCTEQGYDKWVCSKCGDINKRNLVDALGHDWGDWKIVKYPTETENGLQERFCQRDECGARDEQIIIYGKFYLVTFYNYDGTRLMPPAYYEYGAPAIRPRKNPVRAADTAYTYEFIGWSYSDKQIDFVSERMAIIAQYTAHERYYDVTYKNEDGSVLATVKNVGFSQIAEKYPNPTPTKASDSSYDYTFGSWSINCDMNKGEAIATATYKSTPKKYEPPEDTGSSSEENLFTRIINWIKNFFNKLFGRG